MSFTRIGNCRCRARPAGRAFRRGRAFPPVPSWILALPAADDRFVARDRSRRRVESAMNLSSAHLAFPLRVERVMKRFVAFSHGLVFLVALAGIATAGTRGVLLPVDNTGTTNTQGI